MHLAMKCLSIALAAAFLCAAPSGYRLLKQIPVPGAGSWDYVLVDGAARRVYVTHQTEVNVLDADTNEIAGKIPDTPGVHGVAIAPEFGRGYVSAGIANAVIIFDLKTLSVTGQINTEKKPDAIAYDPATKKIFAMNGDSNSSTVIDPADNTVKAIVPLGGDPEFAVADGQGNVFVNLKTQNQVARLDSKALKVLDHWSTAPCTAPSSLALDTHNRRLFVGCRSKVMAVIDADTGRVVASYPIGGHVDATAYDLANALVFNSTGEGNVVVFHQDSADSYTLVETIKTNPGSKTMGFDSKTGWLFVPAKTNDQFSVMVFGR
jgi:YVTN family beta-propeller protein